MCLWIEKGQLAMKEVLDGGPGGWRARCHWMEGQVPPA